MIHATLFNKKISNYYLVLLLNFIAIIKYSGVTTVFAYYHNKVQILRLNYITVKY